MKYLNALWKNHYSRRILFAGIIYALSITSMIVGARLCYREDESGLSKKIGTYFFEGGLVGGLLSCDYSFCPRED